MRPRITTKKVIQRDYQKVVNEAADNETRSSVVAAGGSKWSTKSPIANCNAELGLIRPALIRIGPTSSLFLLSLALKD